MMITCLLREQIREKVGRSTSIPLVSVTFSCSTFISKTSAQQRGHIFHHVRGVFTPTERYCQCRWIVFEFDDKIFIFPPWFLFSQRLLEFFLSKLQFTYVHTFRWIHWSHYWYFFEAHRGGWKWPMKRRSVKRRNYSSYLTLADWKRQAIPPEQNPMPKALQQRHDWIKPDVRILTTYIIITSSTNLLYLYIQVECCSCFRATEYLFDCIT